MTHEVTIRSATRQDAPRLAELACRIFLAYVAGSYRPRGTRRFLRRNTARGIRARLRKGQIVLVAASRGVVLGVIAVRSGNHVSLLFVEPAVHRQGVGRRLFSEALARMRTRQPDLDCVTVNASDFAIPFYRALGFEPASAAVDRKGARITLMRKALEVRAYAQ
jgi:GNAT superfamily N-acetyltransferase